MADDMLRVLSFDRGIEQIMRDPGFGDPKLPDSSPIYPSEEQVRPRLDAVLVGPSLDDVVDRFLRPAVRNKDVLMPERYSALLDGAQRRLRELADDDRGNRPVLAGAAALLEEEDQLRTLLHSYRATLLRA